MLGLSLWESLSCGFVGEICEILSFCILGIEKIPEIWYNFLIILNKYKNKILPFKT